MISELHDEIDASRQKILRALGDARDVTFLRIWGNIGDQLIYAGARQLLSEIPYVERSVRELPQISGHTALLAGGGGWCGSYHEVPRFLEIAEQRFERVVVLPSSFDTSVEAVKRVLAQSNALIFAREEVSYEQVRNLCRAELAHDTAFFFDFTPYRRHGQGTLTAFRTDPEARSPSVPMGNNDISASCDSLDQWLWMIARHELVLTDRAHVMIAAAMLGKGVRYGVSNYHKVQAIVDFALKRFPVHPIPNNALPAEGIHQPTSRALPLSDCTCQWEDAVRQSTQEIARIVPTGSTFVLVDQNELGQLSLADRRALPFLERQGQYWGPPRDDATGICEVERLRESGADWLVFAWPAFWWLKHYATLRRYLESSFNCPLNDNRVVVFDLRCRRQLADA
jgi:exopolysaccharide biosynthesis predicted pyruvyltransferase EpsI